MSFDNQETDKGYTGDDDHDKQNRRKNLLGKKTDGKKGQKDKGYVMFDEDDSDESLVTSEDVKSPSKLKKPKGFKFSTKKKDKDKDEKKEVKKEEKEKKKEGKEHKKHKKDKKKNKPVEQVTDTSKEPEKAIFGVQLTLAVERNRCYDGVELPAMFRECIDYIEEHGLSCEGIYRISGVKSKIQLLKDCYNKGLPVFLEEHEPNIVASLLKQFLRELPEPVLTTWLMPKFEEASILKSEKGKVERFHKLIHDLPKPNRMLLSWMIVHMTHVIERQKENKMSLQNVSIVLSPTMQISHRVLNVLFSHVKQLFKHTELKKYKPPIKPAHSKWSLELPDSPAQLEEELLKQESLLNSLHEQLRTGISDQDKEEQLWEVQRVVTQLKRKIKMARKGSDIKEKRKSDDVKKSKTSQDEELKLELKEIPHKKQAPQPPSETAGDHKLDKVEEQNEASLNDDEKMEETFKSIGDAAQTQVTVAVIEQNKNEENDESEKVEESHVVDENIKDQQEVEEKTEEITGSEEKFEEKPPEMTVIEEKFEGKPSEMTVIEEKDEVEDNEDVSENQSEDKKIEAEKVQTVSEIGEKAEEAEQLPGNDEEKQKSAQSSDDEFEQQVEDILEQQKDIQAREFSEDSDAGTIEEDVDVREINKETSTESTVDADATDSTEAVQDLKEEVQDEVKSHLPQQSLTEQVTTAEQDVAEFINVQESDTVFMEEDEELVELQEEEHRVKLEEEELIAIEGELRTKIETEKNEIDRLQQEITELQYLRQDSDLEEYSSTSDSSSDSEDEEDLQEILNDLLEDNESLEKKNADLCNKIHEERMICLAVKVQIRMLQQKQLESSGDLEKDLLW
ncbi:ralA-binding protein 1-like isoform X1 [Mytilus californianus]|uniref:ralA-binding protein 1-like isoform X1 n=1 Tax=Mytilus californianus TaxID=6549 RepID=UPI002246D911|nr:ralA-binding protein 1-like isoform X1 [Mytilus californianus]XP_052096525.1 ralA-binding protein 1-like isoform X1 [Mytilus californianus]